MLQNEGVDAAELPMMRRIDEVGACVAELRRQLESGLAEIKMILANSKANAPELADQPVISARTSFSVDEVATMLGKSKYSVREWCRHGQVNANRRSARRTGGTLWSITADEIARYKNEGLLPIDSSRNTSR